MPTGPGLFESEVVNFNGNDLKRIPRHKAALWGAYDIRLALGTLTAGGAYSYTGKFFDNGANRELDEVPERHRLDLYLSFRDNRDTFRFRIFVDNVTDEGSARGIGTGGAAENYRYTANYLYPRFYGVELAYRFHNL
jgi:outer membrane receptor protein involved in Fe transport